MFKKNYRKNVIFQVLQLGARNSPFVYDVFCHCDVWMFISVSIGFSVVTFLVFFGMCNTCIIRTGAFWRVSPTIVCSIRLIVELLMCDAKCNFCRNLSTLSKRKKFPIINH